MIFNRDNKGNEELRTLTGSYYKSNDFDKVSVKIMLATEELTALISQDVYDLAEKHYLGENYLSADPSDEHKLLNRLVQHVQLPVAFLGTLWHYQGNDLSHEDSGRKMKINADAEKVAWEWQYERDDAAAMRNYNRAYDRLIRFLNANVDSIPVWKDSDVRKKSVLLFINTAEHFNRLFPIDNSPVFFLRLVPLMREVERKHIKPILGDKKFEELKKSLSEGTIPDYGELYEYVCDPIPLLAMSMAVKRFSLTVIPEGVVQNYISDRQTAKASSPATLEMVNDISDSLRKDGMYILNELKKYWSAMNADETDQSINWLLPRPKRNDKFIGL